MGDSRRFDAFAEFVARQFPAHTLIADVAGGHGGLRSSLYLKGFARVDSWDKRHRNAKARQGYVYSLFHWDEAPDVYDAVVGMHADQAQDHIVMYAIKHRKPFVICPCCLTPSAVSYGGVRNYRGWVDHLSQTAQNGRMEVTETSLPIRGANLILLGRPIK